MPAELYGPAGALAALAFVVLAMLHGDLVPGWVYRQEREQRIKGETQAERNADAIEQLTAAVKAAVDARRDGP